MRSKNPLHHSVTRRSVVERETRYLPPLRYAERVVLRRFAATFAVGTLIAVPTQAAAYTGVARIVGPDGRIVETAAAQAGWAYPADGSIVQVADVAPGDRSLALSAISLVGGRLRVATATVGATASATGLVVDGVDLAPTANRVVTVPGVGWAIVLQTAVIPLSDGSTRRTSIAVRLHLTAALGGLPSGSEILVGYSAGTRTAAQLTGAARDIPTALVPIYRQAARRYGVPWSVLAAINRVETSFGRDLSVSSAGALGWMQFMPGTWRSYGTDANGDGKADPYDPVDAINSAARLLQANGASRNLRGAVWLYNHSNAYVDLVISLARSYADGAAFAPGGVDAAAEARSRQPGIFSPVALW